MIMMMLLPRSNLLFPCRKILDPWHSGSERLAVGLATLRWTLRFPFAGPLLLFWLVRWSYRTHEAGRRDNLERLSEYLVSSFVEFSYFRCRWRCHWWRRPTPDQRLVWSTPTRRKRWRRRRIVGAFYPAVVALAVLLMTMVMETLTTRTSSLRLDGQGSVDDDRTCRWTSREGRPAVINDRLLLVGRVLVCG